MVGATGLMTKTKSGSNFSLNGASRGTGKGRGVWQPLH